MEDNNNKSNLSFDLDEIMASVNKAKEDAASALDKLNFDLNMSEPSEKTAAAELVLEPEKPEEKTETPEFNMEAGIKSSEDSNNAASASRVVSLRPSGESPSNGPMSSGTDFYNAPKSLEASRPETAPKQSQSYSASSTNTAPTAPAATNRSTATTKKDKKYVTRGAMIACMILTMLLSTLLGSLLGSGFGRNNNYSDNRAERNDSELSQLNLSDATGGELTVAQIVDKNEDAVVEIVVSGTSQGLWGQMQLTEGAGSGVIIRDDGYIATNYHVIQGANRVQVTLHNGNVYSARIVGSDSSNDIAVIKIDESGLTTAEIGDSSTVDVGDLAVAIGNPLGQLGGTATTGIISALDRTLTVEGTPLTLLQTDAAINGGNSGGGLFNSRGELIGIVESKASAVGVEGLAFALPINSVAGIINDIIESGGNVSGQTAGTPAVGIVISDVSEDASEYYGLEEPGVYIAQVTGMNAMRAGFQEQDRIVSFNGTAINNSNEFITMVRKCKVGDTVTIVVSRNGQEIEIRTELEELQSNQ